MSVAVAEDRECIGPYRVIKAIGAGGSARIDLARIDRAYNFQRHVVIKRPLEHLRGNAAVAASLQREARIGGRLRHPNLVAILDAGTHDGYDYLVLEYIHGASLRTLMQTEQSGRVRDLPLPVALAIVIDVARGMHEAHELTGETGAPLGLVHRDVSPGNVLLGLDGTVKLADFGIAKETRVSTLSGSIHGTVTYMAPEQCQGHAFDRRADVFSLGVILYELCTGTRLFWADNDVASLHRVLSGNVPRPRKVKPQLASALEDIILAAVAHDPQARLATARELANALEGFAASAGEIVGARAIQHAMEEAVGPKHVPWVAATTIPDIGHGAPAEPGAGRAGGEGSLIDIIAATPDDEPPSPVFGAPGASALDDALDDDLTIVNAEVPAPLAVLHTADVTPRRRRFITGIVIGGLAVGSAATALVMLHRDPALVALPPLPAVHAPAPAPAPPAPVEAPSAPAPAPAPAPAIDDAVEHAPPPASKHKKKRHGVAAKPPPPPAEPPTPTVVSPAPPAPGPSAGSAAPHKVEWNEHQLFPDEGSGARKSP